MYSVGTSILYGRMGVCEIESIGEPPFQQEGGRCYYKLRSRFSSSGELIYIPVDSASAIRPLIDDNEASDYLKLLPQMKPAVCSSRRPMDLTAHYQEMLASCDIKDCLMLLKEIYCKQKELDGHNKKLGQVDSRYLKIAERLACEEFAAVLHTTPDLMRGQIYAAMDSGLAS